MILHDDFIKDRRVLDILKDEQLWDTKKGSVPPRGWYEGWWKSPPKHIWEKLIEAIWLRYPNVTKAKGFEWWTNIHENGGLGWHQDKDEDAADKDQEDIICPDYGAIFYPYPHACDGGMLEVMFNNDEDTVERFAPAYNRLIMFDPAQFHRVSKVYTGERRAFIVNIWMDHVPRL